MPDYLPRLDVLSLHALPRWHAQITRLQLGGGILRGRPRGICLFTRLFTQVEGGRASWSDESHWDATGSAEALKGRRRRVFVTGEREHSSLWKLYHL